MCTEYSQYALKSLQYNLFQTFWDMGQNVKCYLQAGQILQARKTQYIHNIYYVHAMRMEQRGSTERSEVSNGKWVGGPPPEKKKKIDCKWCNQSYSGASLVTFFLLYFDLFIIPFFLETGVLRFFQSSWQLWFMCICVARLEKHSPIKVQQRNMLEKTRSQHTQ